MGLDPREPGDLLWSSARGGGGSPTSFSTAKLKRVEKRLPMFHEDQPNRRKTERKRRFISEKTGSFCSASACFWLLSSLNKGGASKPQSDLKKHQQRRRNWSDVVELKQLGYFRRSAISNKVGLKDSTLVLCWNLGLQDETQHQHAVSAV